MAVKRPVRDLFEEIFPSRYITKKDECFVRIALSDVCWGTQDPPPPPQIPCVACFHLPSPGTQKHPRHTFFQAPLQLTDDTCHNRKCVYRGGGGA